MRYIVKHKNIDIVEVNIDEKTHTIDNILEIADKKYLPVEIDGINSTSDNLLMNKWLMNRGIPNSREGIDIVLRKLSISDTNALMLLSYGLNLTDHYWICPKNKNIDWNEINFIENTFSEDIGNILFETINQNRKANLFSPDSSLNGMLKKRWKIIDGKRYLVKGGTSDIQQEPFNEVIASKIMERLDIDHVSYDLIQYDGKYYSICECMIDKDTELLSADYVLHYLKKPENINSYEHYINTCEKMGIKNARSELEKMIMIDYVIANTDRHHNNFGIIRDANTLNWIKLAPIYDSGTSLWNTRLNINPDEETHSSSFTDLAETNERLIKTVKDFNLGKIEKLNGIEKVYAKILLKNVSIDKNRRNKLSLGLNRRIKMLETLWLDSKKITKISGP
jgi:hypothetical protein